MTFVKTKIINEQFFDDLTNQSTQYVLGFLYADGNLHTNPKKKFSFVSKDCEILEKMQKVLQTDYKIGTNADKNFQLQIYSDYAYDRLTQLGLHPRKSLDILYPDWANRHFIRGYFDGDGTIYKQHDRPSYRCDFISGSRDFIIGLEKHLSILGLEYHYRHDEKHANCFKVYIHRKSDVLKLKSILYDSAEIYLGRKWSIFQKWV